MIIDALDILHSEAVGGFCLVSSDSDYTKLAVRIRESGFFVMGIGRQKTPKAFTRACDLFVFEENLTPHLEKAGVKSKSSVTPTAALSSTKALPLVKKRMIPLLCKL